MRKRTATTRTMRTAVDGRESVGTAFHKNFGSVRLCVATRYNLQRYRDPLQAMRSKRRVHVVVNKQESYIEMLLARLLFTWRILRKEGVRECKT